MAKLAAVDFGEEPPEPPEPPPAAPPQVFVRTFTIPAGMPWDQERAAQLEARHGAPLPIVDLVHRLKRLEGWAPGRIGRYAVFYVRRRDVLGPFETTVEVDGQPHRVAFGSVRRNLGRLRSAAILAAAGGLAAALLVTALLTVLSARSDATNQLERLERESAAKLRVAQGVEATREESRELARMQGASGLPVDVLDDLAWVARNKTPESRVVALHWDRGLMAIEARGATPPIGPSDRQIIRGERPVRPGVWPWGVSRRAAVGAPVAAGLPGGGP